MATRTRPLIARGLNFPPFVRLVVAALLVTTACATRPPSDETLPGSPTGAGPAADDLSPATLASGQRVFRFDTFGDEQFWTDTARMHEVVQKSVSPTTALSVGLKVDADAIPPDVAAAPVLRAA